jgi:hypothetical protein
MPLYRKIIIVLANNIFKLLLFFSISIIAAVFIYTDRSYVGNILEENNAYENVVSALLETNKEQSLTVGGDITLEDPEVQEIIMQAFPAEDLKNSAETVINAFYDWLENKTPSLNFEIDLTNNKQILAEGLSNFAINRLQSLPVCTEIPAQLDPFSSVCQPPNINYEEERVNIEQQLIAESGFLDEPIITQDNFISNEGESSFIEEYRQIPTLYSLTKSSPVYIALVLLMLALIVIFTSSTKKIGIRKIGRGLVGAGVSLIFFTVVFSYILPSLTGSLPIFQSSGNGIDALLNELSIAFGQDYALMVIQVSAPLIIIGGVMIIYANLNKNKKDYKSAKLRSGIVNSNEKTKNTSGSKKISPPIQSSESSKTKPKKRNKNKKYRKVPKKEI